MIRSNVNPLHLPQLFFAGRALLTFHNAEKNTHMTVKSVQARDKKDRKIKLPFFFVNISLLGDSDGGFRYAGIVYQDTMTFRPHHSIVQDGQMQKVMLFIMESLKNPQLLRDRKVSLLHEGKCCRCALPLTNPASIDRGLGDDCHAYIFGTDNVSRKKKLGLI